MEGESDNNEYSELMKRYNELKLEIKSAEQKRSKIGDLDQQIFKIKENINNLPVGQNNNNNLQDTTRQDEKILELQKAIAQQQRSRQQTETLHLVEILRLQQQLNNKKNLLSSKTHSVDNSVLSQSLSENRQLNDLQSEISKIEKQIEHVNNNNVTLLNELAAVQSLLHNKQLEHNSAVYQHSQNEQSLKNKTAQIQNIEKQFTRVSSSLQDLRRTIQQQQHRYNIKNEENRKRGQKLGQQLSDLQQLRSKLKRQLQLKQKQRQVQRDRVIVQYNKLNQRKQQLRQGQKQTQVLQKHSGQLQKRNGQLRKKTKEIKQEEKEKEKGKNKNQKTFKMEIVQLQKQNQQLQKQLEREQKKHQDIVKLRSSYVSHSELSKLQEQYTKLSQTARPLEVEQKKHKKLLEQNKLLRQRIDYLKKADEQAIKQKKNLINEVKAKSAHLIEQKTFYQKSILLNESRLKEYMKQFPSHQAQKEQRKRAKKHKVQNQADSTIPDKQSNSSDISVQDKKKRRRQKGRVVQEQEELPIPQEIIETSGKDLLKNRNAQLAALGAVVILGLLVMVIVS